MISDQIKSRLLTGGIWALVSRVLAGFLLFFIDICIARTLPTEEAGLYFICFSFVLILSVASQCGLNISIVKLIAGETDTNKTERIVNYIVSSFLLYAFTSLLIVLLISTELVQELLATFFNITILDEIIIPVSIWFISIGVVSIVCEIFRGLHDLKMASLFSGFVRNLLIIVVLIIGILLSNNDLYDLITLTSFAVFCASALSLLVLFSKHQFKMGKMQLNIIEIIVISFPFYIFSLSQLILRESHLWIVAAILSEESIAYFAVVMKISLLLGLPLALITGVVQSTIREMYVKNDQNSLQNLLTIVVTTLSVPSLFVLSVIAIYSQEILAFVFGNEYVTASSALRIVIVSQIINTITGVPGMLLMMSGYGMAVTLISIASGSSAMIASILLIQTMGIEGAAIAFSLGMIMQNYLFLRHANRKLNLYSGLSISGLYYISGYVRQFIPKER